MEYQLGRPLFVRVVSQYTATRREALVDPRTGAVIVLGSGPSTATASNVLRTDWLFSFRPAPGTVFFAGYGGSMRGGGAPPLPPPPPTGGALFVEGGDALPAPARSVRPLPFR